MSTNAYSLRLKRRAAGLSQQALAERARCSLGYVRLLESGYTPTHSDVLGRIRRALETSNAAVGSGDVAKTAETVGRHGP